jgi:hypothetical protein
VTLDLNGFSITAATPGAATGIQALSMSLIALRNGTISGFTASVDLTGSTGVLVEDLLLLGIFTPVTAFTAAELGGSGVIHHVVALNHGVAFACPMVVSESVAKQWFSDVTAGSCTFISSSPGQ